MGFHGRPPHRAAGAKALYRAVQDGWGYWDVTHARYGKNVCHACLGQNYSLFQEPAGARLENRGRGGGGGRRGAGGGGGGLDLPVSEGI